MNRKTVTATAEVGVMDSGGLWTLDSGLWTLEEAIVPKSKT